MTSNLKVDVPGALFVQPWWLDAVAENRWDCVEIRKKDGRLVARLPYSWQDDGAKDLLMPKLTQTLGPWVDVGNVKTCSQLARHKDLMNRLIDGLPPFKRFQQSFHYSVDNWLPWFWNGFQQTTRYTYVLDDLSDKEVIWSGFASNIKSDIRKAKKQVVIETPDNADEFFELNEMVFRRQGQTTPYERSFIERLDEACRQRGQRKVFVAKDSQGRAHAGCYIVWDSESAYYIMGGGHPELRRSGATSLCMWEAIQFAAGVTKVFDFEGSMIEPIERFFRGFGGSPKPYSAISKSNRSKIEEFSRKLTSRVKRKLRSK